MLERQTLQVKMVRQKDIEKGNTIWEMRNTGLRYSQYPVQSKKLKPTLKTEK